MQNELTSLGATEREKAKGAVEKGQDLAYTLNHMFACFSFDFAVIPLFGSLTQKAIGKSLTPDAFEDKYKPHGAVEGKGLAWVLGELVGDIGAVPVTIMMQRMFPGFMSGIQSAIEPPLAGVFRHGAHKRATRWGKEQGLDAADPRIKAKEEEVYRYEVDHLPQAFMWTASSIAINIASQRYLFGNNQVPLWVLGVSKGVATAASAVALIGTRSMFPDVVHKSDTWASENLVVPATRAVGGLLGIKPAAKEPWEQRVKASDTPPTAQRG